MNKFLFLFLLMPTLAFGLTVDTPKSQEIIPAGSNYSIQWTATTATKFNLYASYDNGLTWGKALNSIDKAAVTPFDWSVPMPTKNKSKCKIKVIGYNDAGKKVETGISAAFTINVLNVLYPNGPADNLDAGHIKTVTWETVTPAVVTGTKLSYTIDNGLTWLPIATIPGNPGAYNWTVPQIAKTAKVKVDLKNGSTLVATDSSDAAFKIVITPKTKADALGTYYMTNMEYDYSHNTSANYWIGVHELIFDGAGQMDFTTPYWSDAVKPPPSRDNIPYTVSGDGQIIIYDKRGIISDDGNIVLLADPNRFKVRNLDFGMAIKASSGLTEAALNGTYVLGQIGNGWSGLYTATFDGLGSGNVHCDSMTGGCVFTDLPFTYTVDPLTGQLSNSFGYQGIVSADGNLFTNVDYDPGDNLLSISVGIKKSASGLSEATLAGKFLAATIGLSDTHGPWVDIFKVQLNGRGGGTATELYTSWPPLTPPHPVVYSVDETGALAAGRTGTELQGVVMGNGQGFLMIDNTSQGESSMTVGLKTTK